MRWGSGVCILFLLSAACKKDQKIQVLDVPGAKSSLSITNASSEIPSLLFYVDHEFLPLADSPLAYGHTSYTNQLIDIGSGTTTKKIPYIYIGNGYREVEFAMADGSPYIAQINSYFAPGYAYSIFVTDSVRHGQAQYVLLQDSLGKQDSAQAQVRFINLSPDAPPMDIYAFYDAGQNGSQLFANRDYPAHNPAAIQEMQKYLRIKAGPYYFYAVAAGTNSVLLEGGLVLSANTVTTIYAKGWMNGTGENALDVGLIRYAR